LRRLKRRASRSGVRTRRGHPGGLRRPYCHPRRHSLAQRTPRAAHTTPGVSLPGGFEVRQGRICSNPANWNALRGFR
jgi:hypothetical protein